ncbi:MAG: hypothetical protein WC292_05695 [Clostridia bacterium]
MKKAYKIFVSLLVVVALLSSLFVLTACGGEEKVTLKEDTTFYIDYAGSSVLGLPLSLLAENTSRIILRADGSLTMVLDTKIAAINALLNQFDVLSKLEGVDVDEMIWDLPSVFFPGNSIAEFENLLAAANNSIGLGINGFDFQDSEMKPIFDELAATGKLPKGFRLPDTLYIEYNATYHIVELESPYSGSYTAIYAGSHGENGEPYIVLTLLEDEETGKRQVTFSIDFIKINISAKEN